ncbi:MAG TPA: hypothetical protein V6C81_21245 [Planktothrix sp.]|jgi:hypothetical protein
MEQSLMGVPDRFMEDDETARMIGMSVHWLKKGRREGFGPPVTLIGKRAIRYRLSLVMGWMDQCGIIEVKSKRKFPSNHRANDRNCDCYACDL